LGICREKPAISAVTLDSWANLRPDSSHLEPNPHRIAAGKKASRSSEKLPPGRERNAILGAGGIPALSGEKDPRTQRGGVALISGFISKPMLDDGR
jgi:hypothetical protein